MKTKVTYTLDIDALIISLRSALTTRRDFSQTRTRLIHIINSMPDETLQIYHVKSEVYFYSNKKYLSKRSDLIYPLARKRYYKTLLKTIEAFASRSLNPQSHKKKCDKAFAVLEKLLRDYAAGHLKLERIVLSRQQYNWFYGQYIQKNPPDYDTLKIPQGDSVITKSEQRIGEELHNFAVPCHYEQQLKIDVSELVRIIEADLRKNNQLHGKLYTYRNGVCFWNVPEDLAWMNARGSIWRTYDANSGCVTLHPDYTIMLADGSILYWEHAGLIQHIRYRINATERIEIMRQSGIPESLIIRTIEEQTVDQTALVNIIRTKVLPRLWF